MRSEVPPDVLAVVDHVWRRRNVFIRWPERIYDGKFPAHARVDTVHAVKDERLFTHSAGLVAVHPIADALADEVPYFAWLLRREAYKRFKFDPDNVFGPERTA